MRHFNKFIAAAFCTSVLVPVSAFAQETAAEEGEDEPIIVTATLRATDVQDIPLAVTAVAPEALERQGIADIKNLASISPSFNIQSSQSETQGTSIKIRGVGTTGNNTGLESSVGVFIDGVYQSRPGVALGDLVDLERLEILRGPQGTLFGRNTSAGALNITTKRPSLSEFEGFANASYGNYNFYNVQAGVSIPIAQDVAAVRFSGTYRKRDGYLTSSTGAESNDRDRYMIRGQLYAEPSENISIRLLADYSKVDEKCCDAVILAETPLAATFAFHGLPNDGVAESGFDALRNLRTNSQEFRNGSDQWGVSGELKWELGSAKLTSITAYRDFSSTSRQESDFVSLNLFSVGTGGSTNPNSPSNGDEIKTFTQELRLQGTAFDDKFDWLIGAFYGSEKIVAQGALTLGADFQRAVSAGNFGTVAGVNPLFALTALGTGGAGPVNSNGATALNRFDQDGETFSIFTHNVINFTDQLSLTLGARYVDEKKDASFDQLSGSNAACQASVNGVLTGMVPAPLRAGLVGLNCFSFTAPVNLTAPFIGSPLASNFLPLPREFSDTFKDDELTYTAQLSFKPNEDLLLYGSFSHGFKSGGFNLDPTAANLINSTAVLTTGAAPVFADPRFGSEKVDAYELGAKGTFGRFNINLALFQMDLTDFQVLEFTGVQFTTFNVNNARSRGFEIEAFGRLHDYISLNTSVTYAKAEYGDDCDVGISAANLPSVSLLCGQSLTNAPEWAGVVGLTYDGPLNSSGWGLLANGNVSYSGSRRTSTQAVERRVNAAAGTSDIIPALFDIQEDYFKINARIGLSTPDDRFTFELWGTNLSNEITRGITSNTSLRGAAGAVGGPSARSRIAFVEEPRTYGITIRAKFGN